MNYFVFQGKVYAANYASGRAYILEDNGWSSPLNWTWTVITIRDYEIIRELAERESERFVRR